MTTENEILNKIIQNIVVPVIELLFVAAIVYFLFGVAKFFINGNNPAGRKDAQLHMFWGSIGLAIMLSAWGIVNFVFNTVTDNGKAEGIDGKPIERPESLENNGQLKIKI
jgi:hypothetical protein